MAGVFGLKKVYTRQRVDNWPESSNYGYFGGGSPSIATVDRIDFSNETTSLPESNLTQGRWSATTVSNSNYGYFAGGYIAPFYRCTIDRLDFSTEIVAVPPVGNQLTHARYMMSGVSSPDYGYFAGGEAAPYLTYPKVATIDRLDFSSETMAGPPIHGINLTEPRSYSAGVFNRNYGYFAGDVAEIDRIDFSNDTTSEPGVTLTQSRHSLTSVSASNYGYFAGGTPGVDTIDRIDFSNETTSAPGNNLTQARRLLGATSNLNYGYFGGGFAPPSVDTIDRIDFSNEIVSLPGNNLPQGRYYVTGVSGGTKINAKGFRKGTDIDGKGISSTYGYHIGGSPPSNMYKVLKRDYSTETISSADNLPRARLTASLILNRNYAYISGATPIPGTYEQCTIDRLDFSNDTVAAFGLMPEKKGDGMTVATSSYGYYCGGKTNNPGGADPASTVIDRLDFATEVTTSPTHLLTERFGVGHEVSNPNYGYFVGTDYTPQGLTTNCTVERLEFSTETVTAPTVTSPRGQLYSRVADLASFQDSNYGYFAGGYVSTYVSEIDRLDFSNETFTQDMYLGQRRNLVSGNEHNNYGYVSGGRTFLPPSVDVATVDRIEFSTKTVSTAPSIPTGYHIGSSASN